MTEIYYIDHNGERQVVDLSIYDRENCGLEVVVRFSLKKPFRIYDLPRVIHHDIDNQDDCSFYWMRDGYDWRGDNLPSMIKMKSRYKERGEMMWNINNGTCHRTNGPAIIHEFHFSDIRFYVNSYEKREEVFVNEYQDNIIERLRECPSDIQFYKIPNFELQKTALDKDISVMRYIEELHPDFKDTKCGNAKAVGLFDE